MSKETMQNTLQNDVINGEIATITPEIAPAALVVLTTKDLQTRIEEETEQRKLITQFISNHMKDGVDFGRIHISKNCEDKYSCSYAKHPGHFSKPSLFKPGSEKFVSLFHFRPTFERDDDTWEMAGKPAGLFCYKCNLIAPNGAIVGEGRGTARVGEKQGQTENNVVKIAEKRAQIDAVLRTGGLSDFFTQDIEDMNLDQDQEKPRQPVDRPQQSPKQEYNGNKPLVGKISENQQRAIVASIKRLGVTEEDLKTKFNVASIVDLSKQDASNIIDKLFKMKSWE